MSASATAGLRQRWAREDLRRALVVNLKDGSVLVQVPAGAFEMGDGKDSDCPKRRVELSAYWIGVHPVTNRQYARFVSATGHRAPDDESYRDTKKADHPVVYVSWDDAAAYAKWAGCALPTEAQWEKAARGPRGLAYPWGNDWDAARCRNSSNRGSETTCAVWEYPAGVSGYGVYQASGNVWEWCADWYDSNAYKSGPTRDPTGPAGGSFRVDRGGGWRGGDPSSLRAASRSVDDPAYRGDFRGFRLARTAS